MLKDLHRRRDICLCLAGALGAVSGALVHALANIISFTRAMTASASSTGGALIDALGSRPPGAHQACTMLLATPAWSALWAARMGAYPTGAAHLPTLLVSAAAGAGSTCDACGMYPAGAVHAGTTPASSLPAATTCRPAR